MVYVVISEGTSRLSGAPLPVERCSSWTEDDDGAAASRANRFEPLTPDSCPERPEKHPVIHTTQAIPANHIEIVLPMIAPFH